jgi:hypothetical protein
MIGKLWEWSLLGGNYYSEIDHFYTSIQPKKSYFQKKLDTFPIQNLSQIYEYLVYEAIQEFPQPDH